MKGKKKEQDNLLLFHGECVIRAKNNVVQSNPAKTDSFGGTFDTDSFRGAFNSVSILTGCPCSEAGSYDDICT